MRLICIRHSSITGGSRAIDQRIKGPSHKRPQAELRPVTMFAWPAPNALEKATQVRCGRPDDNAYPRI
jgi:hypothetical protein